MNSTQRNQNHPSKAPLAGLRHEPLTAADAAIIKGMLSRGDRQSDISAWFGGVNAGRIAEISTGARFTEVVAAPSDDLPPPGPYVPHFAAQQFEHALESARAAIDAAQALLDRKSRRN